MTFWKTLILNSQEITATDHGVAYLEQLKEYSNNIPAGIFCGVFEYRKDSQFEKILDLIPAQSTKEVAAFVADLICETSIAEQLPAFSKEISVLQAKVLNAFFRYVKPARISNMLSEYLYGFGIYRRFANDHSEEKAEKMAHDFTNLMYDSEPENVVCFHTASAWGDWFDQWSCSDFSSIIINRNERFIWIVCVTDSD